jgi:hypothetical protein
MVISNTHCFVFLLRLLSCVPDVASFSGFSILDCPFDFCNAYLGTIYLFRYKKPIQPLRPRTSLQSIPYFYTSRSFPHSKLITGFVTRLTRRLPLVEQELLTLLEHLSSPPVFSGIRVTWSLCFICMFCRSLFVLFL